MNPADIIDYWFSERIRKHWFSSTPALDREIADRYQAAWTRAAAGELDEWQNSAEGCLALIILLDQFPLNMFRGEARSFQTEAKAIVTARIALDKGFDKHLSADHLAFLFMPFMHSEKIEDQELSVALYSQYNLDNNLAFARHHRDIVGTFGRFPHRNAILGRTSTPQEIDYLRSDNAFRG